MNKMSKLKKIIGLGVVAIVLSVSSIISNASDAGYYIENMNVSVNVNEKREYEVTEIIDVYFKESRRGIIRSIPKKSSLEGYVIKDVEVLGEKYKKTSTPKSVKLKIGDKNVSLTGDKRYKIKYTLAHHKDKEDDGDYVYLNVLGTEWDTSIRNFESTIRYPEGQKPEKINITSGLYGSESNNLVDYSETENSLDTKSKYIIGPGEGVTVNLKFEDGVFSKAPMDMRIIKIIAIPIVILGGLWKLIWYFRNRNKVAEVIEFYPPDGLNSAELGYLYSSELYDEHVVSLIYQWAHKGYLKITVRSGDKLSLTKLENIPDTEPKYEQKLFNRVFGIGADILKTVTEEQLKYKLYDEVKSAKSQIEDKYKKDERYKKRMRHKYSFIIDFIAGIFIVIYFIYASLNVSSDFGVISLVFSISLVEKIYKAKTNESSSILDNILSFDDMFPLVLSFIGVLGLGIIGGWVSVFDMAKPVKMFVLGVTMIAINRFVESEKGNYEKHVYARILGFKRFMETAEKDRLEALMSKDPEYFYKILPYAQVLDVTEEWVEHFEIMQIPPCTGYDGFSHHSYVTCMTLDRFADSAQKEPSTGGSGSGGGGGFSGGGFSGGGSGGGGGSSW